MIVFSTGFRVVISKDHLHVPIITTHMDLGDQTCTIPPDLLPTTDRPDVVVIDYNRKSIPTL